VLRAPKEASAVVSVHTTAIVSEMQSGNLSYNSALQKVAASLNVDARKVVADFNKETDPTAKAILKTASNDGLKRIQLALAGAKPFDDVRKVLASATGTLDKINNVVVIYLENRSFNNLYGLFPGANGISNAMTSTSGYQQLDRDGVTPLASLPAVWSTSADQATTWAFVAGLPNKPFRIDAQAATDLAVVSPDLVHRFYTHQMQINGGVNNQFAAWSSAGGLTMGYYDGSPMKLWKLAQQYTLSDRFFQAAFGGSFVNHFWLVCACSPVWANPPASQISAVDASGTRLIVSVGSPATALNGPPRFVNDGSMTPLLADGNFYAVNTVQPPYQPSQTAPARAGDPRLADPNGNGSDVSIPLPALTDRNVGDALTAKGVNWKWYAGGWNKVVADRSAIYDGAVLFQTHHQPFNYFRRFDPTSTAGAAERAAHLKDYIDLLSDIQGGTLPPVAFYKPQGTFNQHPGYASVAAGDAHVADLVAKLQASPQWKNMLIIITYDEFGGWWDHVAPPKADLWGPGSRIPAIIISPFAKRGYVDSVVYDTTSIIKFITRRFGLEPLPGARQQVSDLSNALDLSQP
jgi:acid phosphatase